MIAKCKARRFYGGPRFRITSVSYIDHTRASLENHHISLQSSQQLLLFLPRITALELELNGLLQDIEEQEYMDMA